MAEQEGPNDWPCPDPEGDPQAPLLGAIKIYQMLISEHAGISPRTGFIFDEVTHERFCSHCKQVSYLYRTGKIGFSQAVQWAFCLGYNVGSTNTWPDGPFEHQQGASDDNNGH